MRRGTETKINNESFLMNEDFLPFKSGLGIDIRLDEYEEKRDNYMRKKRSYSEFKRSFYADNIMKAK